MLVIKQKKTTGKGSMVCVSHQYDILEKCMAMETAKELWLPRQHRSSWAFETVLTF